MASSIFGSNFGFTFDGSTVAVTGAVTATGNITATGNLVTVAGTVGLGSASAAVVLTSSNIQIKPADGGAYFQILNSGAGVAVNSAPLLLQSGGTTRARIANPANNTINLTDAAGTAAPTLQVGGVSGAATFGPAAPASITVSAGVVTAAS